MASSVALERALEAIHQIPDAVPPWSAVLCGCADVVGGDTATFIALDARQELLTVEHCGISALAIEQYTSHFHAHDIVTPMAFASKAGAWLDTAEMFARPSLERQAYYVDYMRPHRMLQMLTFIVEEGAVRHSGLTIQRSSPTSRARDGLERPHVRRLTTALAQAVECRRAAADRWVDAMEVAFGSLGEAMCVVTPRAAIHSITAAGGQLFTERSGLSAHRGQLWHFNREARETLQAVIARVAVDGVRHSLSLPNAHGGNGEIDLAKAPARLGIGSEALVLVRLRLRETASRLASAGLRTVLGLTRSEEGVLAALVAGQSPEQYAHAKGLSIHTVRKQIAVIKEKAGCSRTVELVIKAMAVH